jgi:hypothetical protein
MDPGNYCPHGGRDAGILDLDLGGSNDGHGVQDYAPTVTGAEAGPL